MGIEKECQFNLAYIGPCKKPCAVEFCAEHLKEKCDVCGKQADHQCEMGSSLVCGRPVCSEHLDCKYHSSPEYLNAREILINEFEKRRKYREDLP